MMPDPEHAPKTERKSDKKYTSMMVCTNLRGSEILPSCGAVGSRELADALEKGLIERNLPIEFKRLHCMGKCHLGPTMRLTPAGPFIMGASQADVSRILDLMEQENFEQLAAEFPLLETIE